MLHWRNSLNYFVALYYRLKEKYPIWMNTGSEFHVHLDNNDDDKDSLIVDRDGYWWMLFIKWYIFFLRLDQSLCLCIIMDHKI